MKKLLSKNFLPIFLLWCSFSMLGNATDTSQGEEGEIGSNITHRHPAQFKRLETYSSLLPTQRLSLQDAEGIIANHHPSQFKGREKYDPAITEGLRHFFRSSKHQERWLVEHCPVLIPLKDALKIFMDKNGSSKPFTKKLQLEMALREGEKNITPVWLLWAYFRYAASVSEVSEDERDLFMHVVNPHIFTGLLEEDAWQDDFKTLFSIGLADDKDNTTDTSYYSQNMHFDMLDYIEAELFKALPIRMYYPCAGIGKFGLSFLVNRYLEMVFPLGLPSSQLRAHGTKMSQVGFIVHDGLHGDVDPRLSVLKMHVFQETDEFVGKGGGAKDFVKFYVPQVSYTYAALMEGLKYLSFNFLTRLLPAYGYIDFVKTMAGFHIMIHEYPSYETSFYKQHDFEKVLESLVDGTKESLFSKDVWESSYDPLKTSPLDGKSVLSNQKIKEHAFKNYLLGDPRLFISRTYSQYSNSSEKENSIRKKIENVTIKTSPRFIDVNFSFKSGQSLRYTYTTLYHKWLNIEDSLSLLKLTGVVLPKPDILNLGLEESRKTVLTFLKTVRQELGKLLDHFLNRGLFFATYKGGNELSFSDCYFKRHFKQYEKINAVLINALARQSLKDNGKVNQ